ncbi:3-beta hydroxysteroid dehydrogenase/isomerase family protein [Naegleria gruberi]|uniref:3-beta hydroxysteroid dehydrogenase/isomerase family protein n=1 Tax=Naegleria gruberi TaxID=5762 RepID=D2VIC9_NAEGR|nr:3-beta hydroxysteroid dehydrogenase/isomerase family protein [Naegleria gruberi]EFC43489.1 3-beta hydroxysteroid dehydrogenase/isomerase family protein [Naegleria gruberi]|eukprot:XP_002676233.1 3-beta hydroxysteroid dehydrogenase/isomerase family protein [Naegleria gruberi strain NEG-M]
MKVCVTGATGFIASHLIYQLLLKGHQVNVTVRNYQKSFTELFTSLLDYDKRFGFNQLSAEQLKHNLIGFQADLTIEGSFDKAVEGCQIVFHPASPYIWTVEDPQRDLVDPAVNGTLTLLKSCFKERSKQSDNDPNRLRRIIMTSSIAALCDTPKKDKVYDERDWNDESALNKNPYYYSKLCAEREAWKFMNEIELKYGADFLEFLTILPSATIGRPIFPNQVNQSYDMITKLTNGDFPAIFMMTFVFVSVKDIALAHILAMEHSDCFSPSKGERFIVCGDCTSTMKDTCEILKEQFTDIGKYPWIKNIPSLSLEGSVGNTLARFAGLFQPKGVRQLLSSNIGRKTMLSNHKVKQRFSMKFIDRVEPIRESVEHLLSLNLIKQ